MSMKLIHVEMYMNFQEPKSKSVLPKIIIKDMVWCENI